LTNHKDYGISSGGGKFLGFVMSWFGEIKVWIVMSDIRFGGLTI